LRNYEDLIISKPVDRPSSPESPDKSNFLYDLLESPSSNNLRPNSIQETENQHDYLSDPDLDLKSWEFIPGSFPGLDPTLFPDDSNAPVLIDCESSNNDDDEDTRELSPASIDYDLPDDDDDEDTRNDLSDLDNFEVVSVRSVYCDRTSANLPDICPLQCHTSRPKLTGHLTPRSLVVVVLINDLPCHALLDSGSLMDFVSTTVVDQLKLKFDLLEKPIPLQLVVSSSRSIVKATTTVDLKYQDISGPRTLDIANLEAYDIILDFDQAVLITSIIGTDHVTLVTGSIPSWCSC
jgi:hypothetical protein